MMNENTTRIERKNSGIVVISRVVYGGNIFSFGREQRRESQPRQDQMDEHHANGFEWRGRDLLNVCK